MILAFLSACEADKPAPTEAGDTPHDTARDDAGDPDTAPPDTAPPDTGETADDTDLPDDTDTADPVPPDPWVPPDPACALARPLVLTEVPAFWHVYGPDWIHISTPTIFFADYERRYSCPHDTLDAAEGSRRWEGPCDLDELRWVGAWTEIERDEGDDGEYWANVGEGVRVADTRYSGYSYAFEGAIEYRAFSSGEGWMERDFTLSWDGYEDPNIAGDWIVRSFDRYVDDEVVTIEAYIDASTQSGLDGDYCLVQDHSEYPGCPSEPWGGWVVQGANTLVVTYDPHVACDGCGVVTLDGVVIGEDCNPWNP